MVSSTHTLFHPGTCNFDIRGLLPMRNRRVEEIEGLKSLRNVLKFLQPVWICKCAAHSQLFGDAEGIWSVASLSKYISGRCGWLATSQFKRRELMEASDVLKKTPGKVRKCLV